MTRIRLIPTRKEQAEDVRVGLRRMMDKAGDRADECPTCRLRDMNGDPRLQSPVNPEVMPQ